MQMENFKAMSFHTTQTAMFIVLSSIRTANGMASHSYTLTQMPMKSFNVLSSHAINDNKSTIIKKAD